MLTPLGPMQWKVVPMGAKNGNPAFQRMIVDLLGPVRDCADSFWMTSSWGPVRRT